MLTLINKHLKKETQKIKENLQARQVDSFDQVEELFDQMELQLNESFKDIVSKFDIKFL